MDWSGFWRDAVPHAIRVAVAMLVAYVLWRVMARGAPRFTRLLLRKDLKTRDQEEVNQRVETLRMAFRRVSAILLIVAVAFIILSESGLNITPFLAGLGVAGIAVGFAAQNIVRDVFNGLLMLVEDWYAKGDVVRIAGISGVVEDITLRRTVLRDLDGIVHSVPNGEITVASNFTKDFSKVNMNVSVGYGEDLDRVIATINQVGRELSEDSYWGTLVLEPPAVMRVDNLGDSGIEIKIVGNTRPIKQWDVMGELRRRVKRRFDEEGIEIPWPHTKVYFGNPLEQRAEGHERAGSKPPDDTRSTMEAPNALATKERLLPIITSRPWGFVTDLDGTISRIAPTPEEAAVSSRVRGLLADLRERSGLVAVLSGRQVGDARRIVDVEGLTYVGNHGLETLEGGQARLAEGAEQYLPSISSALREIERVTGIPGVRIERKGVTATVHYRQAGDPDAARSAILTAIAHSPAAAGLKITEGRRVVELRPPLAVNKGTVLRALVERHKLQGVLYLGDDITDLDAFYSIVSLRKGGLKALGIGLVSMENRPEFRLAIDLSLNSVDEVEELMRWISERLSGQGP